MYNQPLKVAALMACSQLTQSTTCILHFHSLPLSCTPIKHTAECTRRRRAVSSLIRSRWRRSTQSPNEETSIALMMFDNGQEAAQDAYLTRPVPNQQERGPLPRQTLPPAHQINNGYLNLGGKEGRRPGEPLTPRGGRTGLRG
jgi:hypothetical protein